MVPVPSIGLIELVILAGVAGLACGIPLTAAVVVVVVVVSRKKGNASLG